MQVPCRTRIKTTGNGRPAVDHAIISPFISRYAHRLLGIGCGTIQYKENKRKYQQSRNVPEIHGGYFSQSYKKRPRIVPEK